MCPVEKASGAVEMASPFLTDPILQKRINEGNIREVLLSLQGYSLNDVLDYLQHQSQKLTDLLQNEKNMAAEAEPPELAMHMMPQMSSEKSLNQKDLQEFQMMMNEVFAQKQDETQQEKLKKQVGMKAAIAADVEKEAEKADPRAKTSNEAVKKATPTDALLDAQNTSSDAGFLLDTLTDTIFDVQLRMQMEEKNEELKAEMDRIVALVRSGKASPVWILVALAKVNSSRNGFLFTQLGSKMMRLNQQATKIVDNLFTKATGDPNLYAAELQRASVLQKEQGVTQQFLLQDMQKLTQNIESVLSFAKKSIDEIFKTKLQIVNAIVKN